MIVASVRRDSPEAIHASAAAATSAAVGRAGWSASPVRYAAMVLYPTARSAA